MPSYDFVRDVSLPASCRGSNPATQYRFTIRVSWDENVVGGATVAQNFVFEMLPEIDDAAGDAEFGPGSGLFELKPVGAAAFQITNRNIWNQMMHAIDNTQYAADSPGGCDVQYRDLNNVVVADKKTGEPFRVSHPGPLEAITLRIDQRCTVTCKASSSISQSATLEVRAQFPHPSVRFRTQVHQANFHAAAAGGHGHAHAHHPETFGDVIQEGFSPEEFEVERRAEESRPQIFSAMGGTSPVFVRADANRLAPELQTAFKNAVQRMVREGTYARLVRHHMDMSHRMHGSRMIGSSRYIGLLRFLAWHRRYLQEFETELRSADRLERPTALNLISIPYWRWYTPFPSWMAGFLPARDPDTGLAVPPRRLSGPTPLPGSSDVLVILNRYSIQLPGQPVNDYVRFTYGLEGYGQRPNRTGLPAHNHVHDWIGGIMANVVKSSTDPMFWIHHAEVDRLWHIWQTSHSSLHPPLTGRERILDPWPETYDDVIDIRTLGYEYASVTP